jgi:hypothetical protein
VPRTLCNRSSIFQDYLGVGDFHTYPLDTQLVYFYWAIQRSSKSSILIVDLRFLWNSGNALGVKGRRGKGVTMFIIDRPSLASYRNIIYIGSIARKIT